MSNSKTILVAGTFDILHESHVDMLRNAKNLGDKLIVMLSTDEFNAQKGKKLIKNMQPVSIFWSLSVMLTLWCLSNLGRTKRSISICLRWIFLSWVMIGKENLTS